MQVVGRVATGPDLSHKPAGFPVARQAVPRAYGVAAPVGDRVKFGGLYSHLGPWPGALAGAVGRINRRSAAADVPPIAYSQGVRKLVYLV